MPAPNPQSAAFVSIAEFLRTAPAWLIPLLVGMLGGGAILDGQAAAGAPSLTRDVVSEIMDERIKANNVYLLQQVDLLLTRDKLERATAP